MPADKAFDAAVKYFQTHDVALDESSKKELGQLTTAMRIVDIGGFRNNNKGYRTYVTFIRDGESTTTVKVRVTVQQRTKHLQAEPWTDPKVLDKETAETAEQLKAALTDARADQECRVRVVESDRRRYGAVIERIVDGRETSRRGTPREKAACSPAPTVAFAFFYWLIDRDIRPSPYSDRAGTLSLQGSAADTKVSDY
jgi:hypothetical protein